MTKTRKRYDATSKSKAAELSYVRGNVREIAKELGLDPALLYRWRREKTEFDHNSFPCRGKPKLTDEQRQIAKLRAKLKDALLERDILIKALNFKL